MIFLRLFKIYFQILLSSPGHCLKKLGNILLKESRFARMLTLNTLVNTYLSSFHRLSLQPFYILSLAIFQVFQTDL